MAEEQDSFPTKKYEKVQRKQKETFKNDTKYKTIHRALV
jgi:hypothetical protein